MDTPNSSNSAFINPSNDSVWEVGSTQLVQWNTTVSPLALYLYQYVTALADWRSVSVFDNRSDITEYAWVVTPIDAFDPGVSERFHFDLESPGKIGVPGAGLNGDTFQVVNPIVSTSGSSTVPGTTSTSPSTTVPLSTTPPSFSTTTTTTSLPTSIETTPSLPTTPTTTPSWTTITITTTPSQTTLTTSLLTTNTTLTTTTDAQQAASAATASNPTTTSSSGLSPSTKLGLGLGLGLGLPIFILVIFFATVWYVRRSKRRSAAVAGTPDGKKKKGRADDDTNGGPMQSIAELPGSWEQPRPRSAEEEVVVPPRSELDGTGRPVELSAEREVERLVTWSH